MNGGIAPSRSAWTALPKAVRASARRGTGTLDDAIAAVAYGRHLLRWAIRLLVVIAAVMVLSFGAMLAGVVLGWWEDGDAMPAVVLVSIACLALVSFFTLAMRANRLLRRNIAAVAAHPSVDLPLEIRLGTRRPRLQLWTIFGFLVAGLAALPLLGAGTPADWIREALAGLAVITVIAAGPAALGLETGVVDGTGIRLDIVDVHVPWTSVGSIRVVDPGRITIGIVGPVTAAGDDPGRWTRSALKRLRPGKQLRIGTARPELAIWVSTGYVTSVDPTARAPRSETSGVRTVESWRSR